MRVISGDIKGLILDINKKDTRCRPTQDRVKEAVFSILFDKIENAIVLDCCSGTGGLGIEALSRGASQVYFVDKVLEVTKKNIKKMPKNYQKKTSCYQQSLQSFFKHFIQQIDILFLDPPYKDTPLYQFALKHISDSDILSSTGVIVCEHGKKFPEVDLKNLSIKSSHKYGSTTITLLTK